MATINVDFEVYKELTSRRASEATSYNDVIRELLGLPPNPMQPQESEAHTEPLTVPISSDWKARGVTFPEGTELRLTYKGKTSQGRVDSGAFVMGAKEFATVEELAESITGGNPQDWIFWSRRDPGESSWTEMKAFRAKAPVE